MKVITVEQFDREWSFYKECLLKIKAKRGGTWQPRHVFAAVQKGEAFPFEIPEGFVIFRAEQDAYDHARILLVWIAYAESGEDMMVKYADEVMALARTHGYDRIEFYRAPSAPAETDLGNGARVRRVYSVYSIEVA